MPRPYYRPDRIICVRKKRGWLQYELAERADIAQGHLSNLERGVVENIGSKHLISLARTLETNVGYILGTTDDDRPAGFMREDELRRDEERLVRVCRGIRQDTLRAVVLQFAEMMQRLDREQLPQASDT